MFSLLYIMNVDSLIYVPFLAYIQNVETSQCNRRQLNSGVYSGAP
jgi:hypothetical protein